MRILGFSEIQICMQQDSTYSEIIMDHFLPKTLAVSLLFAGMIECASAQQNAMQFLSGANAKVAKATASKTKWDGPSAGPALKKNKKIVFIAGDLSDPGVGGVLQGLKEAAKDSTWEILNIDCRGACNNGAAVVKQAIDMDADGIVLAGVDAISQAKGMEMAKTKNIPVVGWHANSKPGPVAGLFTNITSDPKEAAQIAALYGVVETTNKVGMVVLTDNSNPYSLAKSNGIIEVIKQCESCRLLSVEDVPVTDARKKMGPLVDSLVKRHGGKWTHVIAVNDAYFDVMAQPEIAALMTGNKLRGISAGDGSNAAYKRIRGNKIQIGTVSEPLALHGWQLMDELNRAMSKEAPSGYVTPVHLVTTQNMAYDGANKDTFDPSNNFRAKYLAYWNK